MMVTALSLVPLVFLNDATSIMYIIGSLMVLGCGLALFSSPNTNAIMGCVTPSLFGVASSTVGTMRLTGQMLSQGIAMTIIAIYLGSEAIIPELYPSLLLTISVTLKIFLLICILGAAASYVGSRVASNNMSGDV